MPEPAGVPWRVEFAQQLQAARTLDRAALGKLLKPYCRILARNAREEISWQLQAKGGGSDIAQDTLLQATQHFQEFRGNTPRELYAWLEAIRRNELLNFRRRYRGSEKRLVAREVQFDDCVRTPGFVKAIASVSLSPAGEAISAEQVSRIWMAVDALSPVQRRVVQLRVGENLTFDAIGRRIGVSAESAEKHWLRARKRLVAALDVDR